MNDLKYLLATMVGLGKIWVVLVWRCFCLCSVSMYVKYIFLEVPISRGFPLNNNFNLIFTIILNGLLLAKKKQSYDLVDHMIVLIIEPWKCA